MGGHNRAKFKDDFCAVAAQPSCGCSINADYVAVCRPNWPDHAFVRKITGNPNPPPKSFEAHHILCAASVGVMIVDAGGKGVGKLVGDTEWCINTRKNMIAMPLWGHTVKWYCNIPAVTLGAANRKAPPFKNLPQHDWDHTGNGGYQEEVDADLRDVVKDLPTHLDLMRLRRTSRIKLFIHVDFVTSRRPATTPAPSIWPANSTRCRPSSRAR